MVHTNGPIRLSGCAALLIALLCSPALQSAQDRPALDRTERDRAKTMLKDIERAIKDHYFDQTYRGVDLAAHFGAAREKLETAVSLGHAYAILAQAVADLDDSHTFFIPPPNPNTFEYGWHMQIVGEDCFVVGVRPGSDAEAKGLKRGDRILQVEAFTPSRRDLWRAEYLYQMLSPRRTMTVVAQSPGAAPRKLSIDTRVIPGKAVIEIGIENILEGSPLPFDEPVVRRHRSVSVERVAVWRLETFDFEPNQVDRLFDQIVKGASALVLDMRGNAGGRVKTLEALTRRLFDRDVKIADLKGRRSSKPLVAKKRNGAFGGTLVVLIDAESGSAAEMLARVIQLEKRGTVIGDRSSGSVMQSRLFPQSVDTVDGFIPYAVSVTESDVIMTDGKSLEHVGVTPDELLLPAADDLAAGRDPVLSRALALAGVTVPAEQAGTMFPIEWKTRQEK